jgi:heptosyltransferase-2
MRAVLIDTAFLGDLILATPFLRAAAQGSREGRIDLLTSPAGAAATRGNPALGEVHVLHKRSPVRERGGMRRALDWLRHRRPEVAFLPRRSLRSALLAVRAGIPSRIGFDRGPVRWLLTERVPFPEGTHQAARTLELLRPAGLDPAGLGLPGWPLEMFPSAAEKAGVETWLAAHRLTAGRFIALAPGSRWDTKRWPVERFADLARRLGRERPVVIVRGPGEEALVEAIRRGFGPPGEGALLDSGPLEPTACVHLLAHAALLVANDSGALHMGEAAAIPVVGLFGPTTPAQGFGPRGPRSTAMGVAGLACRPCGRHGARRCPMGHWRCMLDLETGTVLAAVRAILDAGPPRVTI